MAVALVALGSNAGDRAANVAAALRRLAATAATRLIARSGVHATLPVGGPAGQGPFLNAAALLQTDMPPLQLLDALQDIERLGGRTPGERWGPRPIDVDLLLYDRLELQLPRLQIPHPRMAFRRFVLAPAAEAAPAMIHPESGWTVAALGEHLQRAEETVAVAAPTDGAADRLMDALAENLRLVGEGSAADASRPALTRWSAVRGSAAGRGPKLILALGGGAGSEPRQRRTMLGLPPRGPVAWIGEDPVGVVNEALAAVQAVWPAAGGAPHRPRSLNA